MQECYWVQVSFPYGHINLRFKNSTSKPVYFKLSRMDINSKNISTRGFAERNTINAPIQRSAADIIKIAMISIQRWLEREKLKTKMIMQVHDELVFDLHVSEQEIVKPKIKELMKTAVILDVPMEVEVGVGKNWLEAH